MSRETVTRPDGRTWRASTKRARSTYLMPGRDGRGVLVARTHDVAAAWEMAEQRWRAEHGADAPAPSGRLTWARIGNPRFNDRSDIGLTEVEGIQAASFPAVVFEPPVAGAAAVSAS